MYRQTPYQSFNERLADLRASLRKRDWLRGQLADAASRRDGLTRRLQVAHDRLRDEVRDVERLEGDSLLVWFYGLLGLLDGKLEKERAEVAAAALISEETEVEIRALDSDVQEMKTRLADLDGVEESYRRLHAEAVAWVTTSGDPDAWKLFELIENTAETRELYREIWEAMQAAKLIHKRLHTVRQRLLQISDELERAGGASPPSREAMAQLHDLLALAGKSGNALGAFRKELEDVRLHPMAGDFGVIDRSVSFGFGAIFFTRLVREWMERGHPDEALRHVDTIHDMVKTSMGQLETMQERLKQSGISLALDSPPP